MKINIKKILFNLNKLVMGFKNMFWNDRIKDLMIFFTFIIVMITLILPNLSSSLASIFAILILLVTLSYLTDNIYGSGITIKEIKSETEKQKKDNKKQDKSKEEKKNEFR